MPDLTLAALCGPLFDPPEHPISWPPAEIYPPALTELRARWRKTRSCEHVLRMYREHRSRSSRGSG